MGRKKKVVDGDAGAGAGGNDDQGGANTIAGGVISTVGVGGRWGRPPSTGRGSSRGRGRGATPKFEPPNIREEEGTPTLELPPGRGRGRGRGITEEAGSNAVKEEGTTTLKPALEEEGTPTSEPEKRRRGRPRKSPLLPQQPTKSGSTKKNLTPPALLSNSESAMPSPDASAGPILDAITNQSAPIAHDKTPSSGRKRGRPAKNLQAQVSSSVPLDGTGLSPLPPDLCDTPAKEPKKHDWPPPRDQEPSAQQPPGAEWTAWEPEKFIPNLGTQGVQEHVVAWDNQDEQPLVYGYSWPVYVIHHFYRPKAKRGKPATVINTRVPKVPFSTQAQAEDKNEQELQAEETNEQQALQADETNEQAQADEASNDKVMLQAEETNEQQAQADETSEQAQADEASDDEVMNSDDILALLHPDDLPKEQTMRDPSADVAETSVLGIPLSAQFNPSPN
ncbi:hypothetical protein GOP47_0020042 [Adiantum capillus-veneris]|uniref:AT hook domain-containing protein n=1 Tax=Adiantum capillus-veneris TaxID=13818 RepID=A0A9D4Z963_ADICA|nr:hypothetical protein GOP47_0020042 [Adiantum capillus-veneris]